MSDRPETGSGSAGGCPFAGAAGVVEAHVLGELASDERADFERHLETCPACRDEVASTREVVAHLRSLGAEQGRDLAQVDILPGVLGRIPDDAWPVRQAPPRPGGPPRAALKAWSRPSRPSGSRVRRYVAAAASLAAAACLAAAVVSGLVLKERPEGGDAARAEVVARALDWLASSQEADGSWRAERWGGHPDYTVGLTGLAVLSFLADNVDTDVEPLEGPRAELVERASDYIVRSQARDGRLGPRFGGAPYNHGIATVALIEYYALSGDPALRDPIMRALGYIRASQTAMGGWGYSDGRQVNTAISAWQLSALLLASSLDWPDARSSAEKGLAWLRGMVDAEGRAGYDAPGKFQYGPEGPTAMAAFLLSAAPGGRREEDAGAGGPGGDIGDETAERAARGFGRVLARGGGGLDYCRSYFFAYARHAVAEGLSRDEAARGGRAEARERLLASQVTQGPEAGSFEPLDRWSLTGGRVYATAMATLSLQADERAPRLLAMMRGTPR